MGVSLGIGALAEGAGAAAADFALPAAITSGVEAGIADVGLGTLGAEAAGAGLAGDVAAGGLSDLAAGSTAAELLAAGVPELAAPVEASAAAAGSLAPAAGALAPVAAETSPAIAGLGSAVSEAVPGALAEGAGVTPLTETALDFSLPASTEAGINAGIEEATAQGATQAATQGVEQLGTQAATQAATQTAGTGLSQLAPGAQQVLDDAGPLSYEPGSQLAQAAPQAAAPPTAPPIEAPPVAPPTAEAPPAPTSAPPASTAPPAVQPMNPPAPTTPPTTPPTFAQPQVQQAVENLARAEAPLAPGTPSPSPLTPDVGSATSYVKSAADAGGEGLASKASSLAGKAGDYLAKNPTAILSALGMAANMMKGQQPPKYSAELQAQAAALQAQGAQLQGYLTSGTLPPGIGAALSGAHDSAAAAIRSRYANMGMAGSSAEMQDLNNLAQTTMSQGADIANKLLATGVSEQQFASGLYQNLMATSMQQDTNMSNAISGFTNAMAKASAVGS